MRSELQSHLFCELVQIPNPIKCAIILRTGGGGCPCTALRHENALDGTEGHRRDREDDDIEICQAFCSV